MTLDPHPRWIIASAPYKRVFFKWLNGHSLTPEEEQILAGGQGHHGYAMPLALQERLRDSFLRQRPSDRGL